MKEFQHLQTMHWNIQLPILRQFLEEKAPYGAFVLQPPKDNQRHTLTFVLRKGDGVILVQQQRKKNKYMLTASTSKYNVLSHCSALRQDTYVVNVVKQMIEQRDQQEMSFAEFCEKFNINPKLPSPP